LRGRLDSLNFQQFDAAQQCAGPTIRARQTGVCGVGWSMEIVAIVFFASVVLYMLHQIEESVR
jgi:hypothetical protein